MDFQFPMLEVHFFLETSVGLLIGLGMLNVMFSPMLIGVLVCQNSLDRGNLRTVQERQRTFLYTGLMAAAGWRGETLGHGWNNGGGETLPLCRVCLRLVVCGCVGVHVQGWNKGSAAYGQRVELQEGLSVPMATLVEDGHCGGGRAPYELSEDKGTLIWMAKLAEFDFLDVF